VQLFCHYAPATWQARLDREAVNAICETLNHFPLALMIMAGQMNRAAMTPGRMLCGLRQRMVEVLNERGGPNLSPPAFSLRVALSFAYCALSGRGRLLFFYLGLLPGGMSQPMLDELMGPRFAAAAQELVTYHLAVWPGNAEDGRYRMAAPIRAYTLERRRPARMLLARRRVLQFYANRVTTLDQQLAPLIAGQTLTGSEYALAVRALQSFDQERLNLSAAVEMALLGKMWGTLLILVRRQEAWQTRRALWAERAYHELLAGKAAEELDDELQINLAVHNLGQIYHLQGHWVEAVDTYRQALKLAFDLNAPAIAGVLQSIIALAHTMAEAEQWTMVMRLGYEVSGACEVQTRPGWPTPEIAAQGALCREVGLFLVLTGQACDELTDTETEATLYQEALAQARRIDDQTAARWALAAWIERLG
jgi:tetratricopeptide (TPR) repeat protein